MNPKISLAKLSIKGKLIFIIMAVSVSVLLLASCAFAIHEYYRARRNIIRDTSALGRLVANRSVAALVFDDPKLCQENLDALRDLPSVQGAGIFGEKGNLIARYRSLDAASLQLPSGSTSGLHYFSHGTLIVCEPIWMEDKQVGTVAICSDLNELKAMSRQVLVSALGILVLGVVAAYTLSSRLQRIVSDPISKLTATAERIGQHKDYSLRADKVYDDELGLLVDTFNGMLSQIQDRDRALQETNDHLESQVQSRTLDLREANAQLAAIFEAATNGIVLIKNRVIARCNRTTDELFGYAPGEMIGQTTRIWYPDEETFNAIGKETAACMTQGTLFFREQRLVRKDGSTFWARMTAQAADRTDPSVGLVGIVQDITLERENKEALQNALEAAKAADQIKSAFLATMSHELRTPLNSIIGFTGILLQGLVGTLNPEQKKQLGMVKDSATHLLDLINDVLDISKIEAGQLTLSDEDFDLRASIEKVVQNTRILAERKRIALEYDFAEDIPKIRSDRRRVEQVLLNLLSNAIKFTEHGSVRIDCRRQEGDVVFRVKDTGIGIAPEDVEHLFKPFSQIDTGLTRKYEGTGLGLSICRRLVELMGGRIWVESKPNEGSTFAFTLPLR